MKVSTQKQSKFQIARWRFRIDKISTTLKAEFSSSSTIVLYHHVKKPPCLKKMSSHQNWTYKTIHLSLTVPLQSEGVVLVKGIRWGSKDK